MNVGVLTEQRKRLLSIRKLTTSLPLTIMLLVAECAFGHKTTNDKLAESTALLPPVIDHR